MIVNKLTTNSPFKFIEQVRVSNYQYIPHFTTGISALLKITCGSYMRSKKL